MSQFEVSVSASSIVFTNTRTGKADPLPFIDKMEESEAVGALEKENRARESGSRAAVSLLAVILDNPRFDAYKGATPIGESIPKELKAAMREAEGEFMKPLFMARHEGKGAKPATVAKLWDDFIGALREGSSYAVAKGKVLAYFAHLGKLPVCLDANGKERLLSVSAIDKLLLNAKSGAKKESGGIAQKLLELAEKIQNHDGDTWDVLGDTATGIAALEAMLSTYRMVHADQIEKLTELIGNPELSMDVGAAAAGVLQKVAETQDEPALI